jgi:hypothetical protein
MALINAIYHNYYTKMLYTVEVLLSIAKHLKTF